MRKQLSALVLTALVCVCRPVLAGEIKPHFSYDQLRAKLSLMTNVTAESDPQYQQLVFNDVSNTIENLELHKQFDQARELAELKLSTSKRLFGEASMMGLDAIQDLIFLSVQQQNESERKRYLAMYVAMVDKLKQQSNEIAVENASDLRSKRLQHKLEQAAAEFGGHL